MGRRKSTDTKEVKALRKLLLSLGLSATTADDLIAKMAGRLADLSAEACNVQLYIAAHPEIRSPRDCAAKMLYNFVNAQPSAAASPVERPAVPRHESSPAPVMELWGDD